MTGFFHNNLINDVNLINFHDCLNMNKPFKKKSFVLFALVLTFISSMSMLSCGSKQENSTFDTNSEHVKVTPLKELSKIHPNSIRLSNLKELLGVSIDSLPEFIGFNRVKSVVEDDEGLAEWDMVEYFDGTSLIFIVESNWKDRDAVHRITVFSDQIKENDLYVGQTLVNVIDLVDNKVPVSPDGYLFVKLKDHPEISVQLDISGVPSDSPLYYGIESVTVIPDSLNIESIVIMSLK